MKDRRCVSGIVWAHLEDSMFPLSSPNWFAYLTFLVAMLGSPGFGDEKSEQAAFPDGFKFGVGWSLRENSSSTAFELQFPTILKYRGSYENHFSFYAKAESVFTSNVITDEETGNYNIANSMLYSFGLNWLVPRSDGLFTSYAQIGATLVKQDPKLSGSSEDFAASLAIGVEIPVTRNWDSSNPSVKHTSMFIQHEMLLGAGASEKVPSRPRLFGGNVATLGARIYY